MLSAERSTSLSDILIEHDRWRVRELVLTPEKLQFLWEEESKFRSLFSDLTKGDFENYMAVCTDPQSYWLEVIEGPQTVGLVYWTGMQAVIDVDVHVTFFDRKPAEKLDLCKTIARWFFEHNPQVHRMTATLPIIYHATIRLAEHIGFRREGLKRQSQLMGGKRIDEVILGLLATEIL